MAGSNLPPVLSRRRPATTGDEEATAILRLGNMSNTPTLSVAECNELLNTMANRNDRPPPNNDVYVKTREYLKIFSRFQKREAVTQVDAISRRIMDYPGATYFERAQLGNCCITQWEMDWSTDICVKRRSVAIPLKKHEL